MRSTIRTQGSRSPDDGAGGFVLWIVVYAAFMLALIAFNGGPRLFGG